MSRSRNASPPGPHHGLYLCADGTWLHDGQPVTHPRLATLLHRSVAMGPDGVPMLTTGRDVMPFAYADTPLRVLRATVRPHAVVLLLSNHKEQDLEATTLRVDADGSLACVVNPGLEARFTREAQLQLADAVDETPQGVSLTVGGHTHVLVPLQP